MLRGSVHAGLLAVCCLSPIPERHPPTRPDSGRDGRVTTQVTTQKPSDTETRAEQGTKPSDTAGRSAPDAKARAIPEPRPEPLRERGHRHCSRCLAYHGENGL